MNHVIMDPMEQLIHAARTLFNIHLVGRQVLALGAYEKELMSWNEKFNLTAIRDVEGIRTKHFLDSFSCVLAWKANPPTRLIDVGTGAGFPGLPLKILYPSMQLTLVESVGKKAAFCQHMVDVLRLDHVNILNTRAETAGQDPRHREQYDWAVARAVAGLNVLGEYLLPLLKIGGTMLAQKGESGPAEAHTADKALKLLGGKLEQVIPLNLPGVVEDRYLVLVDKVHVTPSNYPRKAGMPAKQPLP
ncbi:MAG: Ribosomal RNA small subunit methyltransferase G [Anaerolineales bacterium]|nr:Ribosomal RNA small subunit methyltransferase G [Anaerolineales bacterium]